MKVYIPTYGRAGSKMPALEQLGSRATLVTRWSERNHHMAALRRTGCHLEPLPDYIKDVGTTRHWIVKHSDHEFIWMLDDDLLTKNIIEGIEAVTAEMKRVKASLGCLGPAFMANARFEKDGDFSYNKFGNAAWCVRRSHYIKHDVDMSRFATSEDMYCWLKMMTDGCRTVVSNRYLARKREGQGGGCAEYRTPRLVKEDMERLHRMFRPYYKLSPSHFKSQGYKLGVCARVSWAKLAKERID